MICNFVIPWYALRRNPETNKNKNMAEEDEVDVLGDPNLNSFLAKNDGIG